MHSSCARGASAARFQSNFRDYREFRKLNFKVMKNLWGKKSIKESIFNLPTLGKTIETEYESD